MERLKKQDTAPSSFMLGKLEALKERRLRETVTASVASPKPETSDDPSNDSMDVEAEHSSMSMSEHELLEQDDDYLRTCIIQWIDNIRRYHR